MISDQIVDYEIGKVKDGNVTPRWSVYRSDGLLRDRLVEYKSSSWQSLISVPRPGHGANIGPKVHSGVVLSGNKIIADAKTAGALASIWTRALAIEMEAAGIAAALHQAVESPGFIMVKAVCDHADASKNDEWQQYASEAAAAFVISYVFEELSSHAARVIKREPALPDIISTVDLRALRFTLSKAFDLRELRILVSDLGVDWDNVAGSIKDEKIVELIWHMERRGALSRLINVVNEERPRLLSSFSPDV